MIMIATTMFRWTMIGGVGGWRFWGGGGGFGVVGGSVGGTS